MQRPLILILCFLLSSTAYGQLKNPAIRLSAIYTHIPAVSPETRPTTYVPSSGYSSTTISTRLSERYESKPGVELNFGVDAFSFSKFFVRIGMTAQYLSYKRSINAESNDYTYLTGFSNPGGINTSPLNIIVGSYVERDPSGNVIVANQDGTGASLFENDPKVGQTTVLYMQLPVTIGRTFLKDKIRLQLGVSPSFLVRSTVFKQMLSYEGAGSFRSYVENDRTGEGFTRVSMNGLFEMSYALTNRVGLHINYQRSFSPIYTEGNRPGGRAFLNVFALGASYRPGKLVP